MNDFSELEDQLRKLRPVAPSDNLAARIEGSLADAENCRASVSGAGSVGLLARWRSRFTRLRLATARQAETPYKLSLGLGLAAAATLLIFAHFDQSRSTKRTPSVASISPKPFSPAADSPGEFIPAGLTRVVYNTRDEGLQYRSGSAAPVRRMRSHTRETLQWRNSRTGASLRVSYPSEEVSLIPVSGH